MELKKGLAEKGWGFLVDSPTNQQFPILPDAVLDGLRADFGFSVWQKMPGGMTAVRFCTGWNTKEADIAALLAAIPHR